jgi:tetratricopeptide (TPR) repeat protein
MEDLMSADEDGQIDAAWEAASREDPTPTVRFFESYLEAHGGESRALFEYASALDFAGREDQAVIWYERAFDAGLNGDLLRRALIQYGSTLRNLGRYEEAVASLRQANKQFPRHDSVIAFLALALIDAGHGREAVARLLSLVLDRVESPDLASYASALRHYAATLDERRPSR